MKIIMRKKWVNDVANNRVNETKTIVNLFTTAVKSGIDQLGNEEKRWKTYNRRKVRENM